MRLPAVVPTRATRCYSCTVDPASLSTLPTLSVRLPAVVPTRAHMSLFGTSCFFLERWVCDGQRKTCPSLLRGSAFTSCSAPSTLRTETSTDLRLAMPLCNQNNRMASDRHNKNKAPPSEWTNTEFGKEKGANDGEKNWRKDTCSSRRVDGIDPNQE